MHTSVSVEKFATGPKIFLSMKTVFGHMIVPPYETLDLQWFKGQMGGHEFRVCSSVDHHDQLLKRMLLDFILFLAHKSFNGARVNDYPLPQH